VPHEEQPTHSVQPHGGRSNHLHLLLAGALVIGCTLAYFYVVGQPPSYAGPLLVLDHVYSTVLAIVLLGICAGVGRRLLYLAKCDLDRPLDEITFSTVVGTVVVSVSILICGLFALLWTPVILTVLLIWILFARKQIIDLPKLVTRGVRQLGSSGGNRALALTGIVIFTLAAAVLIIQAVAPPSDWDSLMYHLQIPRHFLQEGRIYVPQDNLHVAYVGLVHMLYLPLLALGSSTGPVVLSVLMALLLGLAVFSLASRFFSTTTASVSLITLWATTGILLVAITPRVDVSLALFLFLAQYALLIVLSEPSRRSYFFLAAFLLGSAVGVKYSALAYALALAPLVLWIAYKSANNLRESPKPLVLFGALVAVAAMPWIAKNFLLLGAPLYPFFSDSIMPPWLASLYGSNAIPAGVDPAALGAVAGARMPFNLIDLFVAPGRLTVEQEGAFYHMNLLYLLLPLSLLFFRNKVFAWLVLPAVGYLFIILVPFPATNLRYLIPAFAPLTIAAAYIADRSSKRFLSAGGTALLLTSVAVLSLFPSAKAMRTWLLKSDVLGSLTGATSQQVYLETGYNLHYQVLQAANSLVPSDGKLLLLYEGRGFYFEREVIQDNALSNWTLLAPMMSGSETCLDTTGITHVLVNDLAVRYYVRRGMDPRLLRLDSLSQFARRCLTVIHRGQGFTLLRLNPDPRLE